MRLAAITLIVTVAPFTAGTEQSATDYLERGQTQYAEGKLDEAIASFRKAIEVEPHPDLPVLVPFLHVTLSANLADGSFAAGAIAEYLMVVERKPGPHQPDLAEAYYNLGLALRDTGELNEAIGLFLWAILYQPDLGVAYLRLSRILQDLAVVMPWRAAELEEGAGVFYRKAIEHQSDIGQSAEENHYARALHERGEFDGAIAAYRNAIGVQPGLAEPDLVSAHNNLGRALHAMGELDEAIAAYRKAIELVVSGPPIDNVERGTPRFAPAEALVRRASSSLSPDFELPVVHHNLGRALHQKGELDEAIAAYRKAIELKRTNFSSFYSYDPEFTYYNLGTALHDRGKLDEAIYFFYHAWPGERFRAETLYGLGLALREAGLRELDEARRLGFDAEPLSESTTRDGRDETTASTPSASPAADGRTTTSESPPVASSGVGSEASIAYYAGYEFYLEGAFAEAVASYRKAVVLQPDLALAHYNLGDALRAIAQPDEAVASYRKAIELQPDMLEAHIELGKTLLAMGQVDEAIAAYRTAIEIQPDILETHIERGTTPANSGAFMLRKAIRLHDALTDLGRALHDKGELDETIPAYQEATLRAGQFRAEAQYGLGLWLREHGERKLDDARRLGFNVASPPLPATQDAKDQAMPPPPLYFGIGQVDKADNFDSAAQAPDPTIDAYTAYQAGNAFRQESALREAVASYRKAVAL